MYATQQNAANPIQQPQGYAVIPPHQVIPQQPAGYHQETQQQNQYYYYYGGGEGQLTDITPTQQMINNPENEEKMNYNEYNASLSSPKLIEHSLMKEAPKSPALLYNMNKNTYSMPITHIDINTELHIATAFVSMKITFKNTANSKVNCLFVLPCNGTVTSTKVNINNGSRYLDTTFIDNDSAEQFEPKQRKNKNKNEESPALNAYIPGLFRLPIADIAKNEAITIQVDYMENLQFVESRYHFYIPLNFGKGILPNNDIINIQCSINSLVPGIKYGSTTHDLILTEQENLRCKLVGKQKERINNNNNKDFHLHYLVETNAISAALLCDKGSEYEYNAQQSFTCFVNPPSKMDGIFSRDIVFLLDRSGSMTGKPYSDAVRGLIFALNTLTQYDRFSIIAFDHEQIMFDPQNEGNGFGNSDINNNNNNFQLYPAHPNTIQQAIHFLNNIGARGMTDIKTPLMRSINHLNENNGNSIPFIVLLTDGAVDNEREIVKEIINLNNNKTRILTFGIGTYCNEYFLKMLSLTTRGWNDGCIYPSDLYPKIKLMMDKAKTPILTDIKLEIPHNLNPDIYPKTVPDLFINGPIIISGKYSGNMPQEIILKGKLQNGELLQIPIRSDTSDIVPVGKIFIKQRMDQLNAAYWLNGDNKIKQQIIDISVNETFPSPYTSMVAYELTPKEKEEQDKDKDNKNKNNNKNKKKGGGLSGGQIAALAGGAVVVGAGVFLLGNVAATMGNINIIDGIGDGIGNIGDIFGGIDCPCDACIDIVSCGNCDCGAIANIGSCGICENCDNCLDAIPCGNCDGGCIELPGCGAIGDICDSCGGILGDCFDSVGDICGNLCECIPECIGGIGDAAGNCCDNLDCIGDLCGNFSEIVGGLCGCIGEIGGGICEMASGVCECIGGIAGAVDVL